jgi:hypothetical protein
LKWLLMMMIAFVFDANAQIDWTPATKHGNIMMTGTSQTNGLDFDVSRNVAGAAGIKIFNSNTTGRSLILLGEAYGGKYGYLSHHSQSHVSDPGYTQTYKPSSTVLTGSDVNGLAIVSKQDIRFHSGGEQDGTQRMVVKSSGNVGIGTTNPDAKLAVKGTIHANEVKVDLNVPGPDYVFATDYQLQPLNELKTYIDQNKHLPEVPSAAAMEADGINLGEMNMLLLKKVEELTLYLIEKDKELQALKSDIEKLKNQNYEK